MKDITSIRYILKSNPTQSSGARYECEIDLTDDLIYGQRGLNLLVQLVLTECLKTPGRDVISPRDGGGLLALRGLNPYGEEKGKAETMVALAIKRVEQQILSRQIGKNYLPSETLKSLDCGDDIYFDPAGGGWFVPLILTNVAGESRLMDLPVVLVGTVS